MSVPAVATREASDARWLYQPDDALRVAAEVAGPAWLSAGVRTVCRPFLEPCAVPIICET